MKDKKLPANVDRIVKNGYEVVNYVSKVESQGGRGTGRAPASIVHKADAAWATVSGGIYFFNDLKHCADDIQGQRQP